VTLEAAFAGGMLVVAIIGFCTYLRRRPRPPSLKPPLPACQRKFQQALREQQRAAAINHRTSLRAS
jgi:hypothetical protein